MNGRWRECSWGRPGSWTSRWSLSRWWAPTMSTISWCPLFRYRVTRKSPCQLCLCQTDDSTGQTQVMDQNLTYFHFDLTLGLIWPLICLISSSNYLNRDSWMKLINFFWSAPLLDLSPQLPDLILVWIFNTLLIAQHTYTRLKENEKLMWFLQMLNLNIPMVKKTMASERGVAAR